MLTATNSWATVIGLGNSFLSAASFASPSMIGPKSVPLLPKKYLMPRARSASRYACPTVSTGIVTGLLVSINLFLDSESDYALLIYRLIAAGKPRHFSAVVQSDSDEH